MSKKLFSKFIVLLLVVGLLFAAAPTGQVAADAGAVNPALELGADRLTALQNYDGGWDWELDDGNPEAGSALNTLGPIAKGLAQAYLHTADADHLAAVTQAASLFLTKTTFATSDGYLAAQLDAIFNVTTYTDYVKANFYEKLEAGTYVRGTVTYNTSTYVTFLRNDRTGSSANLAAWDLGLGLVSAASCGVTGTELQYWIDGVKAEINELDDYDDLEQPMYFFTNGLSGALYGLAFVNETIDPTAGYFASEDSIDDLFTELASYQINNGGVAWHPDFTLANDQNEGTQATAYAIMAFNEFNRGDYIQNIQGAADYLLGIQRATGGWDNYPEVGVYAATGENNEVTAEALWALSLAYPEVWVCESGSCGHPGFEFSSVQMAINTVDLGGIVHVAAGTYVEDVTVVNKYFNLIGEVDGSGAPISILEGTLSIDNPNVSPEFTTIKNIYFEGTDNHLVILKNLNGGLFENCVFDGNGRFLTLPVMNGINLISGPNGNSNITVLDSTFKDGLYVGIGGYADGLTVQTSEFTNVKSGINLQGGGGNLVVTDSTFLTKPVSDGDSYGIRFASSSGSTPNLTVTGSTFTIDNSGGFKPDSGEYHSAIYIRSGATGTIDISNNTINAEVVNFSPDVDLDTIFAAYNTWPVGFGVLGDKITYVATFAMDPATNAAPICGLSGTTTVAVKVGPVDQLSAYDVTINFDNTLVEIVSVTNGDVLIGNAVGEVELGNDTGTLFIRKALIGAGGVWNTITDPNGGNLVYITLKHKVTGTAVLTLDPRSGLSRTDEAVAYPLTITQATSTFTVGDPVVYNETTLTDFCDLQVAMNSAVDGDYLTLLTDVTRTSNTNFGGVKDVEGNLIGRRAVTLDLNGHTIERTGAASTGFTISLQAGGDLTIVGSGNIIATPKYAGNTTGVAAYLSNDSTLKLDTSTAGGSPTLTANDASVKVYGTGSFTMDAGTLTNKLLIIGAGSGTAVMNDGTINSLSIGASSVVVETGDSFTMNNGTVGNGVLVSGPGATLVLNNGTINSAPGSTLAAVTGSGLAGSEGTQITINGGYVLNDHGAAIFHPQDGDLIIDGGHVYGATAIIMKSGNLDISGGSHIYANGAYAEPIVSGSGQNSTGDAILIYGGAGYTGDITVNIHITESVDDPLNAGQLTSENAYAIREFSDTTTDTRTSSVKISSGMISSVLGRFGMLLPTSENILFTKTLRDRALADVPNDTLLLTGAWYDMDPAYYVFPPLETYAALEVPSDPNSGSGYRIREMAGQLAAADLGFVKYDTGSLGIFAGVTSGWTLTEVTNADIESAVVVLKSGETVLQTNTDIDLDTEFGTYSAFTSPFDIYGTFDYVADDNWLNVRPAEYGQTLEPTCVEATVLLKSGKELTASNCIIAGTYDSIKPIPVISSTDIQGYYLVGEERMFSVSVVNPLYGVNYTDGNYIYFTFQMDGVQVSDFKDGILWFWSPTDPTDYSEPVEDAGEWIAFNTRGANETFYNCGENVCGEFGWASTGFPLPTNYSMTAYLKFTMLNADATAIPVSVDLVRALEPTTPVTSFASVAYVYDKPIVTVSADDYYLAGVPGASTVTIVNPATGYNYDNAVWFDMMIDEIADGGVSAFSCTMNGHTWSGLEALFDYTGVGATLRLGGADGYFTVNTGETLVVDCTITYANAGTYEVSGNMLHVVDKLAVPQETRVVSENYSATAIVYTAPVITATFPAGPYAAGVPVTVPVTITNPGGIPEPFELVLNLPDGTEFTFNGVDYLCGNDPATIEVEVGCPAIPVTLPITSDLVITFAGGYSGDISLNIYDSDWTPADRLLASKLQPVVVNSDFTVTGNFSMQGNATRAGIPVTFTWGSDFETYGPTGYSTSVSGTNFSLALTYGGNYTITTEQPRYLNVYADTLFYKMITVSGDRLLPELRLRAGNAVWLNIPDLTTDPDGEITPNNVIDLDDAGLVGGQWYGPGSSNLTINHGDVNFDNIVNIQDLALVGGNMDLTSAGAYGTWAP